MRIIDLDSDDNIIVETNALALGKFDGFHIGHQDIINKTCEISKNQGIKSSVFIFKNNINEVLNLSSSSSLMSLEDKIDFLRKKQIDIIFLKTFDKKFMNINGEIFIDRLVSKLNVSDIIVGEDYRFGYKAKYNSSDLINLSNKYNFNSHILDIETFNKAPISSSDIKEFIKTGLIKEANLLLNNPYTIKGCVVSGKKRGRSLGFPTANILLNHNYTLPKLGVYETIIEVDNKIYKSLTDIGFNPTFNENQLKIETYILDFNRNIYNKEVKLSFIRFLRKDIKFYNEEDLIEQIKLDCKSII